MESNRRRAANRSSLARWIRRERSIVRVGRTVGRLMSLALLVGGFVAASSATAQGPSPGPDPATVQAAYDRVVNGLMSPFCPGRTLQACPTNAAAEVRLEVRRWLQEGRSEAAVVATLIERFGDDIRGAPVFRGLGIVGWMLVPLVALVGLTIAVRLLRSRPATAPEPELTGLDPHRSDLEARVDREIAELLE